MLLKRHLDWPGSSAQVRCAASIQSNYIKRFTVRSQCKEKEKEEKEEEEEG